MADYTLTPANIIPTAQTVTASGLAAGALTIGQIVYKDTAGKLALAQADDVATGNVYGINLTQVAAADQPVVVATAGPLTIGSGVPVGDIAVLSAAAAGAMAPSADLVSTNIVSVVGVQTDATTLTIRLNNSGTVKA